ncbi:MAG TPA: M28 family metallopeptidase [Pyrinomonadaceae bacterium]|nr:M28 family metallopeptidase [Pyrinomonadaceae bacterium]
MLIIVSLAVSLLLLGCPSPPNRPAEVNSSPPPPSAKSDFDGDRAFDYIRKQVEFGPRPPGSAELEKTRAYIVDQLRSFGLNVTTDEFHSTTPVGERKMANIVAELPGESGNIVIISSHYDTKLFKEFKFVGANDGGSSTGALMEIARVLAAKKQNLKLTYRFVFFDGEEAFCAEWDDCHNPNPADPKTPLPDNTYGSRHYVSQLVEKNELPRVKAMILMDMIGYKELRLGRADLGTTWLQDVVWQTGKQIGYGSQFVDAREGVGDDDHSPFLKAGIDSLDIIQLNTYPYWHTKDDTLDKISGKSLKIVGDAIIVSLPKIEERIQSRGR